MYVWRCTCHGKWVKVRGQLAKVSSLLLAGGFHGQNSSPDWVPQPWKLLTGPVVIYSFALKHWLSGHSQDNPRFQYFNNHFFSFLTRICFSAFLSHANDKLTHVDNCALPKLILWPWARNYVLSDFSNLAFLLPMFLCMPLSLFVNFCSSLFQQNN